MHLLNKIPSLQLQISLKNLKKNLIKIIKFNSNKSNKANKKVQFLLLLKNQLLISIGSSQLIHKNNINKLHHNNYKRKMIVLCPIKSFKIYKNKLI